MNLKKIFGEDYSIAQVAEQLGQTGLLLFPAKESDEGAKAPYTRNGLDDATCDVGQITEYWE